MRYLRWPFDPPLARQIIEMLVEFDHDGYVPREIGLDGDGRVVHRKPSEAFPNGDFGYFDEHFQVDQEIALGWATEISEDEFERHWLRLMLHLLDDPVG